jgi:hypothetical protein
MCFHEYWSSEFMGESNPWSSEFYCLKKVAGSTSVKHKFVGELNKLVMRILLPCSSLVMAQHCRRVAVDPSPA